LLGFRYAEQCFYLTPVFTSDCRNRETKTIGLICVAAQNGGGKSCGKEERKACSTVLREKLTVSELVKKCPALNVKE
jgi:hypothetical protein